MFIAVNQDKNGRRKQAVKKVKYEEMFPHEIEEIMHETPIAYLALGTLEWHGPHLALGNDAVKAYESVPTHSHENGWHRCAAYVLGDWRNAPAVDDKVY